MTLGPGQAHRLNACRSALQAGGALATHGDAPMTPLAPLLTAWCAVNRVTPSGRVLGEDQCLMLPEALRAITLGAAWTLKLGHEIGRIECGKRAALCAAARRPVRSQARRAESDGRIPFNVMDACRSPSSATFSAPARPRC